MKKEFYIYQIKCLQNNGVYVGQTSQLKSRKYSHFFKLRKGTHYNKELQKDFDSYGELFFEFKIIYELKFNNLDKYTVPRMPEIIESLVIGELLKKDGIKIYNYDYLYSLIKKNRTTNGMENKKGFKRKTN